MWSTSASKSNPANFYWLCNWHFHAVEPFFQCTLVISSDPIIPWILWACWWRSTIFLVSNLVAFLGICWQDLQRTLPPCHFWYTSPQGCFTHLKIVHKCTCRNSISQHHLCTKKLDIGAYGWFADSTYSLCPEPFMLPQRIDYGVYHAVL